MSKYPKELLEKAESYCVELGLDNRLVHIPRTKIQADTLYQLQLDCEIHNRASYSNAKDKDTVNPNREQDKVMKAIDVVKNHLITHHFADEMDMASELTKLAERIDIDHRWQKPSLVFDGIIAGIEEQLAEVGFSDTGIKNDLLPVFSAMIKDE